MATKKTSKTKALRCPTCREIVLASDEDFPFCSDRCRRIDLGKWASGAYVISSPAYDEELGDPKTAEEVESMRRRNDDE